MKIKCKKEEFADIVAMCRALDRCGGCVLAGICKMEEQDAGKASHQRLTELVEIEGNPLDVIYKGMSNGYPCDSTNVTLKG